MKTFWILNFRQGASLTGEYVVFCEEKPTKPADYAKPGYTLRSCIEVEVQSGDANTLPVESVMMKDE